jgi:SAM-dependent methyltransferase
MNEKPPKTTASSAESTPASFFDQYSNQYEKQLQKGLSLTGESADYYAKNRVMWLRRTLDRLDYRVRSLLDFGCGVGNSIPYFLSILESRRIVGLDPSASSLEQAKESHPEASVSFVHPDDFRAENEFDVAFCNGVFHHIPPSARGDALQTIWKSLKPGGIFAFWENNPWNPGTKFIMSRVEFDRDAITLSPLEARRILKSTGFTILRTNYLFIFPKVLSWCRFIEPFVAALPLGGQYLVLCKKAA